MTVMMQRIQNL